MHSGQKENPHIQEAQSACLMAKYVYMGKKNMNEEWMIVF